jgi:hypothetical protein
VGSGTLDNLSRVKIALLRCRGSYASHSLMCPHTSLLRDRRIVFARRQERPLILIQ